MFNGCFSVPGSKEGLPFSGVMGCSSGPLAGGAVAGQQLWAQASSCICKAMFLVRSGTLCVSAAWKRRWTKTSHPSSSTAPGMLQHTTGERAGVHQRNSGLKLERPFGYSVMLRKQTPLGGTDWESECAWPTNEWKATVHGPFFRGCCLHR